MMLPWPGLKELENQAEIVSEALDLRGRFVCHAHPE